MNIFRYCKEPRYGMCYNFLTICLFNSHVSSLLGLAAVKVSMPGTHCP